MVHRLCLQSNFSVALAFMLPDIHATSWQCLTRLKEPALVELCDQPRHKYHLAINPDQGRGPEALTWSPKAQHGWMDGIETWTLGQTHMS